MPNNTGMMWFDADKKTSFQSKIEKGFIYYKDKYGKYPTVVYVNTAVAGPETIEVIHKKEKMEVEIKKIRGMLRNNFWFVEDK